MQCDMCGNDVPLKSAEIEGVILSVCNSCAKYGKVVHQPKKKFYLKKKIAEKEPNFEIIQNYAEIMRKSREQLGLNQEQFAKKLNEKVSIIQHIEVGKFTPSIKMARKFEKILKKKFIEEIDDSARIKVKRSDNAGLTIGDMIKIKK